MAHFFFLNENKAELFQQLRRETTTLRMEGKEMYNTYDIPPWKDMRSLLLSQHVEQMSTYTFMFLTFFSVTTGNNDQNFRYRCSFADFQFP